MVGFEGGVPPSHEGGGEDCVGAPVSKKNGQGLGKRMREEEYNQHSQWEQGST